MLALSDFAPASQRSPTSSSGADRKPAPSLSTSASSASTGSARMISPKCVGVWGLWGTGGTGRAVTSGCHGDVPCHVPPAVPLGPGHEDQCV